MNFAFPSCAIAAAEKKGKADISQCTRLEIADSSLWPAIPLHIPFLVFIRTSCHWRNESAHRGLSPFTKWVGVQGCRTSSLTQGHRKVLTLSLTLKITEAIHSLREYQCVYFHYFLPHFLVVTPSPPLRRTIPASLTVLSGLCQPPLSRKSSSRHLIWL